MAKNLIVYYSRRGENFAPVGIQVLEKGNTAWAAEFIRDAAAGDLFEIETVKPYAENYRACCKEAAEEAAAKARPEIKGFPEDISGYDTIFVCYPNWCGTAPMCVFTFLEHYDLTGKTIVPLCTNEGSGLANSVEDIRSSCPGARVLPGLSVKGHLVRDSRDEITAWAKSNI